MYKVFSLVQFYSGKGKRRKQMKGRKGTYFAFNHFQIDVSFLYSVKGTTKIKALQK